MMINNMKPYELNEQEMNEVTGGFMEPAASDEEMFQKLFGTDAAIEANQPGAYNQDDSVSNGW